MTGKTHVLTKFYHLVHTVPCVMSLIIMFPHTSRTYGYPPAHVLSFPACAVLYPICSWILVARLRFPTLCASLDPSSVYMLPCPTCGVVRPLGVHACPKYQVMYHPHCVLFPSNMSWQRNRPRTLFIRLPV